MPNRPPVHRPAGHQQARQQSQRAYDRERADDPSHTIYASTRWRKLRAWFLSQHPLCNACSQEDGVREATVVDHIVPHKGDVDLMWDVDNLQSLCAMHHNRKTATQDGGFGRHAK